MIQAPDTAEFPLPSLRILPLHVGDIVDWPTPALIHMRRFDEVRDIPLIMFAILGGASPIIVDTGGGSPDEVRRMHGYTIRQEELQRPANALRRAGIDPQSVELVVNSHLHWDHCSNNHLFPRARVVIQHSELVYAIDPEDPHRKAYECIGGSVPRWVTDIGRFDIVDGDREIAPGVSVVHLPGHSPGSQGVLVQTASGPHLIAGDCIGSYENWAGDALVSHHPSGTFTSLPDYMRSFRRVEQLDCAIIPSHDPAVTDGEFR